MKGSLYPLAAPQVADSVLGIQNGQTVRFPAASLIRDKARRILRCARAPVATGVLGADPMTAGAANANSTIQTGRNVTSFTTATGLSNALIQVADLRLETVSGLAAVVGGSGWGAQFVTQEPAAGSYSLTGGHGWGQRFGFDGQAFDVGLVGTSATAIRSDFRCRVTDLASGARSWTRAADYVAGASAAYYKFDFGVRAPRLIELYFGDALCVRGYNTASTDTVWRATAADQPRMLGWGDSYTYGATVSTCRGGWVYAMADRLGVDNPIASGRSGTGWVRPVALPTWGERVAQGDLSPARWGELDLICLYGTINDNPSSDADLSAAMLSPTGGLPAILAQQPSALVAVAGPQYVSSAQTPQARYDLIKALTAQAAAGDPRVLHLDTSPAGDTWQTGAGYAGAPSGSGNNDVYLGSDRTHPIDDAGYAYLGRRWAAALVRALTPLAG